MREFKLDGCIFDDKDYVVCTSCALARNGLTYVNPAPLTVFTRHKSFHNKNFGLASFVYSENEINTTDYVQAVPNNSHILVPTRERAIVESIIHLDGCDEGELVEAINTYITGKEICDMDKLYEVADFFGLARSELEYWIEESKDYNGEG